MNFPKIAAICKKSGEYVLFDERNENRDVKRQWFGTSAALYQIEGVPYLLEDSLSAILGITDKIMISHKDCPQTYNFKDDDPQESMIERTNIALEYRGKTIMPVITKRGIDFINCAFLTPCGKDTDIEMYERFDENNKLYFAVKKGMFIEGIIMPMDIINDTFVSDMETLAAKCRAALNEQNRKEG